MRTETDFTFGGSKITVEGYFSHAIKTLAPWEKSYDKAAAAAAKLCHTCPILCDPIDGSPPGSPVPGILQARTLEWVAISFSNAWKGKAKVKLLSCVRLLATTWTTAHQAPLSMGFFRQEYWSGCHCLLQSAYYNSETSLCWQSSVNSKLWFL